MLLQRPTFACLAVVIVVCFGAAQMSLDSGHVCAEAPISRCTCTEMLRMTDLENGTIDGEDIRQAFRAASRLIHRDTRSSGSAAKSFKFLSWCRDRLLHQTNRMDYINRLTKLRKRAWAESWSSQWLADAIEDWHGTLQLAGQVELRDLHEQNLGDHKPNLDPAEETHVFLDNSLSMLSACGDEGERILSEIMPRLARSPASIHLVGTEWEPPRRWGACEDCESGRIGPDGVSECIVCKSGSLREASSDEAAGAKSRRLFSKDDQFTHHDVVPMWTMTAKDTDLWKYVLWIVLQDIDHELEVIILTDGSSWGFHGQRGVNAVMKYLKDARRKLPRFVIRFFGEGEQNAYRDLALASGGGFFGGRGDINNRNFTDYVLLSHASRAGTASQQKKEYETLFASEQALPFSWFDVFPGPSI